MSNFYLVNNARLSLLLAFIILASLLAACGEEARQVTVPPAAVTTAPALTPAGTTIAAAPTTVSNPSSGATSPATVASAPPTAAVNAAPLSTTAAATTAAGTVVTTAAATTAPAPAPTAAPAKAASRPPVGNSYPPGPAPTAAPPAAGLVDVNLQVPEQFRRRGFTGPRSLKLPPGFSISVYSLLENATRFGTFSPDGRLFISERGGSRVVFLKDNGGVTGEPQSFATGLNGPHGLAFQPVNGQMYLYVAENDKVSRFAYRDGQTQADKKEVVVKSIPAGGGHSTRSIAFGPDGKMYIAVGSSCNVCEEGEPHRAAVVQYNADGTGERLFARGLRNEVGIMFHPETGELWGTENSRDNLGRNNEENNNIPPEEINIIVDNGDYGWPYCYSNQVYDSQFGQKNADYCKNTIPPALPMQAHSAPLGLDFYFPKTPSFPAEYKGDAFVAFHGSWNRSPATGFKLVRVRVKDGRPTSYEDFATGWLTGASNRWGRPVAPIVAPDGSLFLTDDENNAVYHITYKG